MRKRVRQALENPLISGSAIIFFGSIFSNILNFLFNLFMTRNLSVADYGVLASIVSLITLSSLPASAILPAVVRFAASYFAKGDHAMIRGLFLKFGKLSFLLGFIILVVFILFTEKISEFFHIGDNSLVILASLLVFFGFIAIVNSALLQARLSFLFISFINFVGAFLKLALGIGFVFLGFGVGGAMWALLLSSVIPYVLTFIPLRFLFQKGLVIPKINTSELFVYGAPSAIALFGLTSFITTDIILVKHFFDPESAGIYAGLSLVGRVIFFLSAPISTVMFPLIVQKHTREENYHNTFTLSLFLVFLLSAPVVIFYFLFPVFTIGFFTKQDYLSVTNLLGLFGIFIVAYSVLSIMVNFFLSIKKTNISVPVAIGAGLQALLLWFFHQDFLQVILISLIIVSLLILLLLLYYLKLYEKDKKK